MKQIELWREGKDEYVLNNGFTLKKADKIEFGIHETIYSNVDLELRFSWKKRIQDKMGNENLFWIYKDYKRVGGVHICPNLMGSLFMETPYTNEKINVINALNEALLQWRSKDKDTIKIYGVIPDHVEYFSKLGYGISHSRRVMIRPTEVFHEIGCGEGVVMKTPSICDAPQIGKLFLESYSGGVDYKAFGKPSLEEAIKNVEYLLRTYESNNILHGSTLVFDKNTNDLIAACIAGISGFCDNDFSEIGEIAVKPSHRKSGLGSMMIKRALSNLKKISPATILCVTIGNPAEDLYSSLGFLPGVKFTNMYLE